MKALEILNRMTGMNEPEKHEIKLDGDARLKAIVDKSVLDAVTTGDRELHAKKKDVA
jgi:hypothetical protein